MGGGQNLAYVAGQYPWLKTFGIDASAGMCDTARAHSPASEIYCGFYGPDAPKFSVDSFDIIMARSTVTLIDESDIDNVLRWIFSRSKRIVIISEPSGELDGLVPDEIIPLGEGVWKRQHDQTTVRDYSKYVTKLQLPFRLVEDTLSKDKRGRTWVFERNPGSV